ncbi:DUF397 domain-containing protein [Streptomyces sp. NPDC049577]|uniref:DUF397 domain-containing protein n=1 Tax=Streptomyces sp. NPDC049577 TaxID=3155153 RepID=UPI00343E43A5
MAELNWIKAAEEGDTEYFEVAFGQGDDENVYIRVNTDPDNIVITTGPKWDAFVLGVKAGEFDHFVEGIED